MKDKVKGRLPFDRINSALTIIIGLLLAYFFNTGKDLIDRGINAGFFGVIGFIASSIVTYIICKSYLVYVKHDRTTPVFDSFDMLPDNNQPDQAQKKD